MYCNSPFPSPVHLFTSSPFIPSSPFAPFVTLHLLRHPSPLSPLPSHLLRPPHRFSFPRESILSRPPKLFLPPILHTIPQHHFIPRTPMRLQPFQSLDPPVNPISENTCSQSDVHFQMEEFEHVDVTKHGGGP